MKICSNGSGLLLKMAIMPVYDENLPKCSSPEHRSLKTLVKVCQVCSNADPSLTFDLFMESSHLYPDTFIYEKYIV